MFGHSCFFAIAILISTQVPTLANDNIDKAVERGVTVLKQAQQPNGSIGSYASGSTALAALALLECGVKPDDPVIAKAAEYIRNEIIPSNEVYHVALSIIFLDRLGEPNDMPLIQALGVRLMEGQGPPPQMGWNYKTPRPTPDEVERLRGGLKGAELKTQPKPEKETPVNKLHPDLEQRIEALEKNGGVDPARRSDGTAGSTAWPDNSNSQFAVLALWIARRNHVPTDFVLRRAEAWYRATYDNGSWVYSPSIGIGPHGRGATTCAGLIGLAVGAGVARTPAMKPQPGSKPAKPPPPKRDALADLQIQTALNFLGSELFAMAKTGMQAINERDFYFLWSFERVAMIYSLAKVGTVDWYTVGSTIILVTQLPTGGWRGRYAVEVDTSFALLFLRRSNFAPDLASALKPRQQPSLSAREPSPEERPAAPGSSAAADAEKLVREFPAAKADRQAQILERLRDEHGSEYSDALVKLIAQSPEELQRQAREYLAERMARMTPATLRSKLHDPNVEFRRAAALACAAKEDRTLVGDLIGTLDDKEFLVVRAVAVALRTLTGEDFGPKANANADERAKSITAWKTWWKKQSP
jgi:hypothetical protein